MNSWAFSYKKTNGFTIVELLIVIVVIAILAAITIVAYTGIQDRAKASTAQSASSQAAKKVASYAVDNSDLYPVDKDTFMSSTGLIEATGSGAGITEGSTYQYAVSSDRKSYCLTTTTSGLSFYTSTTTQNPTKGACDGHGSDGTKPIVNLVTNPSFETNIVGNNCAYGQGGAGTCVRSTSGGQSGNASLRMTWSTLPTSVTTGGLWSGASTSVANAGGKTFTASGYIRNSWAGGSFQLNLVGYTAGFASVTSETYGPGVVIPAGAWSRVAVTWNAPANTQAFVLRIRQGGGTLPPATTATMDVDAFSLYESSTNFSFADGNSPSWVWLDSPNNSVSTGPPLN